MAVFTTQQVSILPPTQGSGAGNVIATAQGLQDAQQRVLFISLQQQIDMIMKTLRQPLPMAASFGVTDSTGKQIVWVGFQVIGSQNFEGLWAGQLYVGGTDASNAPFFANSTGQVIIGQNGSVSVQNQAGTEVGFIGYRQEANVYNISTITNASPPVVTTTAPHGYTTGDTVVTAGNSVSAYNGMQIVKVLTSTTFSLDGVTAHGAGTGGTVQRYFAGIWGEVAAFGGTNQFNANVKIQADGSVEMTNVLIVDTGSLATVTIDPVLGEITVAENTGGIVSSISATGIEVQNSGSNVSLSPGAVSVVNGAAFIHINNFGVVTSGGGTAIDVSGNIYGTSYTVGGVAGAGATEYTFATASPGTVTIQYLDHSSNPQTAIVAAPLSTHPVTFTSGLLTAA